MNPLMIFLNKPRTWLIAITLIGGLLRFTYLLQIEHNTDRAYPIWQALMTLERGVFPLIGQGTSVLFANPPGMGYLLLPVMALTHHALGAYIFVIALNTLGVWFTYKAVRLIASRRAALIAAFLMAVNPWVIEYSRLTWVQGLLPFLVPALAWALWSALLGKAKHPARRLVLAFILLTIAAQTYLLAFALVIPVGLTVILYLWRKGLTPHPPTPSPTQAGRGGALSRRGLIPALVVGVVIFAVFAALYGVGLLSQQETVSAQMANFGDDPSRLNGEALSHAIRLVTGQDYAIARGVNALEGDSAVRQDLSQVAHYILLAAMIIGGALAAYRTVRGDRCGLLPLIWFGVPVALMSYVGQVVHPFYQLIGIPAGFALAGMGLDGAIRAAELWRGRMGSGRAVARPYEWIGEAQEKGDKGDGRHMWRPYGAAVLVVLAIPFGVLMAINSARYAQETERYPGAYGLTALPLEDGLALGSAIRGKLQPGGTVFGDVEVWILSSFAGMTFDYVQDARAPEFYIMPINSGVYVTAVRGYYSSAIPFLLFTEPRAAWRRALSYDHMIQAIPVDAHYINSFMAGCGFGGERSTSGIEPVECYLRRVGDEWKLISLWRVADELPPDIGETLFAPFAHIFDEAGNRLAVIDGQAVPGYEWRPGDIHVHTMTFTLPDTGQPPESIGIGQYDALRNENIMFVTLDGEYTPIIMMPGIFPHQFTD